MSVRIALVVAGLALCSRASAQSWHYQTNYDGTSTLRGASQAAPGYITLTETGGEPVFELHIANATPCFAGPIPAKVARTAETTTITVKKDLKGCFTARFVINNDGTGGRRETIRNGKWAWDGVERGLKPRQP